jgi:hypothetical protein
MDSLLLWMRAQKIWTAERSAINRMSNNVCLTPAMVLECLFSSQGPLGCPMFPFPMAIHSYLRNLSRDSALPILVGIKVKVSSGQWEK